MAEVHLAIDATKLCTKMSSGGIRLVVVIIINPVTFALHATNPWTAPKSAHTKVRSTARHVMVHSLVLKDTDTVQELEP